MLCLERELISRLLRFRSESIPYSLTPHGWIRDATAAMAGGTPARKWLGNPRELAPGSSLLTKLESVTNTSL